MITRRNANGRTIALAFFCLLLIGAGGADAAGSLAGKTVGFDGDPIKKVTIILTSPDDPSFNAEAVSDKDGNFVIEVENTRMAYKVRFEKRGFAGIQLDIDIHAGAPTERTFTLLTDREVADGKGDIVVEREKKRVDPLISLYNQGADAYAAGDLTAASEKFEAVLEIDSEMVPAHTALALIAVKQKDWEKAARHAAATLEFEPDNSQALFAAYRANRAIGDFEAAASAAAKLKELGENKGVAGAIFNEGVDAFRAEDFETAEAYFIDVINLDPELPDAYSALGRVYFNKNRFEEAGAAAEKALELRPGDQRALEIRFESYLNIDSDQLPQAAEEFAAVDSQTVSARINQRAAALFEDNQYDDARRLISLMLEIDPEDARSNYNMGLILVNAGENAGARTYLQKFIDAAPNDPDAAVAREMLNELK